MEKNSGNNKKNSNGLILIPKVEAYIVYMLKVLIKLPRTEKFSIGTEYKTSMYKMLELIMFLNKTKVGKLEDRRKEEKIEEEIRVVKYGNKYIELLNEIDALLNCQRIYLRIMKENYWIDEKKFNVAMEKIYEIGKIIGGLVKYYAKNN